MAFSVYCFGGIVFVVCKRGSFYRGVGYGPTVDKAVRNMTFHRTSIEVQHAG